MYSVCMIDRMFVLIMTVVKWKLVTLPSEKPVVICSLI